MTQIEADESDPAPGTDRKTFGDYAIRGLLGLAALGVVVGLSSSGDGDSEGAFKPTTFEAEKQCERFIDERLKSPGSAEYDLATTGGPAVFMSTGTVDSQNSFGALLRISVSCSLRVEGDRWYLEDLSGLTD